MKFTNLTIETPSTLTVELRFVEEADRADFRIWWERSGSKSFNNWKKRGDEFYNKTEILSRCTECGKKPPKCLCRTS